MNIYCDTIEQFIIVCAGLAREGVKFYATTDELKIELTGGF